MGTRAPHSRAETTARPHGLGQVQGPLSSRAPVRLGSRRHRRWRRDPPPRGPAVCPACPHGLLEARRYFCTQTAAISISRLSGRHPHSETEQTSSRTTDPGAARGWRPGGFRGHSPSASASPTLAGNRVGPLWLRGPGCEARDGRGWTYRENPCERGPRAPNPCRSRVNRVDVYT